MHLSSLNSKFQVNKKNVLKDFVHVAGPLGVTHLLMLSKTEIGTYLVSKDQIELKTMLHLQSNSLCLSINNSCTGALKTR